MSECSRLLFGRDTDAVMGEKPFMDGLEKARDRDGLIALVLDLRRDVARLRVENEQ